MVRKELSTKIKELFSYLANDKKYERQLLFCVAGDFWELAIILLWKYLILFIYEKVSQLDERTVVEKWNKRFYKSNLKDLKDEANLNNLYWPNSKKDEELITFIGDIYPVDQNLIRQVRSLSIDRDTCAHVSEIEFTENEFVSFIDKTLRVMKNLQIKHQKYLENYIDQGGKMLSSIDRGYVVPLLISGMIKAHTYASVEKFEKDLEESIGYFRKKDIEMLLEGVFKSPHNQVLGASYTSIFLEKLFGKTKNFIDLWENFSKELKNTASFKDYYKKLIDTIDLEVISLSS